MTDCPTDLDVGDTVEVDSPLTRGAKYRVAEVNPPGWGSNTVRLVNIANPFDYYLNYTAAEVCNVTWRRIGVATETPPPKGQRCARPHCPEPFQPFAAANMPDGRFVCFSCRTDGYGVTWAQHLFAKDPE